MGKPPREAANREPAPLEAAAPTAGSNLLRTVIDNLPESIFAKDREGRFILANAAIARLIGVTSDEVVGKTDAEIGVPMAAHYRELDERVIDHGEALLDVIELVNDPAGEPRWDMTTKVPFRDAQGNICGLVAISRDITAQKVAEEKLRAANAELSRGREELLETLERLRKAHEELRAAQADLVEAEKFKSISRLANGVAHEVQNPLAIATMGLEFLARQPGADVGAVPAVLGEMRVALQRADQIVRGLLEFSAPAQRDDFEPCDLNALLREALETFRGEAETQQVQIFTELDPRLVPVNVHRGKILQVFSSLLANAMQAMPKGGKLDVQTRAEQLTAVGANISGGRSESFLAGDRLAVVQIDDTGSGIPEDKLNKIFEPFYTTKPTGHGVGLGLAIARTIMDLHGGSIEIQNLPLGGVRVRLLLKI